MTIDVAVLFVNGRYTVLGWEPDGNLDSRRAIPDVQPAQHSALVRAAWDLALTATALADGGVPPIDPRTFESAIRRYRDATPGKQAMRKRQPISPLDQKIFACRICERLLRQVGEAVPLASETGTHAQVDARARQLPALVRAAAQRQGISLESAPQAGAGEGGPASPAADLIETFERATSSLPQTTEAERVVVQRIGQDLFREALRSLWADRCPISGLSVPALLRASHIKPWSRCSSSAERLDRFNGLLLAAHLDAAFDAGLISVSDDGSVLVSSLLSQEAREVLGLATQRRIPSLTSAHRAYLAWHRENVFAPT